jgi:hypothetical protein
MRLVYRLFLSMNALLVFSMSAPETKATEAPVRGESFARGSVPPKTATMP